MIDAPVGRYVPSSTVGLTSFRRLFLVLSIGACTFDTTGTSVGGASLGDGDTGDGTESTSAVSNTSASASGSASGSPTSTTDPTTGMTSPDTISTTDSVSESESETQPTTSTTSPVSDSESESSHGTTTTETSTEDPTTGPVEEPYPPCPSGSSNECPDGQRCLTITFGGDIIGSWCSEQGCEIDADCPVPSTGNAMPDCRVSGGTSVCVLDCSGASNQCPDGMVCEEDIWVQSSMMLVDRCMWEV